MNYDVAKTDVYTDVQGLQNLRYADSEDPNKIKTVAKQFESVFLQMVLKSMRDATSAIDGGIFESDQMDFYQEMFDSQLAMSLSGNLGIADLLEQQLTPKLTKTTNADAIKNYQSIDGV